MVSELHRFKVAIMPRQIGGASRQTDLDTRRLDCIVMWKSSQLAASCKF